MKKFFILAVFCWIGLVSIEAVHAQDVEQETITIQLKCYNQYQFAGYYAAVKKGFYAEEGLKVELRQFDSLEYVDNVLQGRAQYGVFNPGIILRRLRDEPIHPPMTITAITTAPMDKIRATTRGTPFLTNQNKNEHYIIPIRSHW